MTFKPHINQLNKRIIFISGICFFILISVLLNHVSFSKDIISPLAKKLRGELQPLESGKSGYEVFGFAPHWRMHKLDNIDFSILTTLAYFGVEVGSNGALILDDAGYQKFRSEEATQLFQKAHENQTRVVLTITQMENESIESILSDQASQNRAINQTVDLVKRRGIDGINIDFEYSGTPPVGLRESYSSFVQKMTTRMHQANPNSKVTVSVYASAAKYRKLYDISSISKNSDGIFVMAYDFAVKGSDNAMPTAPLYGHREGKYWYDISTAIDDLLVYADSKRLFLGVSCSG